MTKTALRFLLDEGVPVGLGEPIAAAGHNVINFSDVLASGSPDHLVCETAIRNDAILIAIDLDAKQFARGYGRRQNDHRFVELNLLSIQCKDALATKRFAQTVSLLEHEWKYMEGKSARRLWVVIAPHYITTHR